MVVAKDIHTTYPPTVPPALGISGAPLISRTGTLKAESSLGSEDDIGRLVGRDLKEGSKADFVAKADNNADNPFIEDVSHLLITSFPEIALLNVASDCGISRSVQRLNTTSEKAWFVCDPLST